MNKEWKQKWVEALRSGKYQQGRLRLRDLNDKFCCLGVACDIIDPVQWKKSKSGYEYHNFNTGHTYAIIFLPLPTREKMEISPEQEYSLIKMNDMGKSFGEIADWIEENL